MSPSHTQFSACEREDGDGCVRTIPVLPTLFVRLSELAGSWGSKSSIEPPVAYQLQRALVKYLLAISRTSVAAHPSPSVAFPPLTTVPLRRLISAPGPVAVVFSDACAPRKG